ncbi:apolipoprotein N-acyltransferase [Pseudonocardia eucalypti]|uniref:Apolipoprotein N-acyltransferase n=1 Tax=Pseudonocardia eucalypti TaxID=648755 RepID=A0ABP9REA9_9PSEU
MRPPTEPDRPAALGPGRPPAWVGAAARWLAAPLGGVLLYAACAPRTLWWLAPLGFALLGAALRGRRPRTGFALGLLFGLGFFVPLLPWIGIYVGPLPWLVLALLEALFLAAGAAAIAVVGRLPVAPVWAAAVWVATEAAAARVPFGGFPWGKVAYSQADGPFARLAAIGGTPLVSFAVVLTGFGLAALVRVLARRPAGEAGRRSALVATGCAVLPLLAAVAAPAGLTGAAGSATPTPSDRTVTVAAIQGSVPRLGLDFNAQRRAVLDNHVKRTLRLAEDVRAGRAARPDLVIWPENSSDIDPLRNADAYREISVAAHEVGRPILVGAVLVQPDGKHTTNSALVWDPVAGPVQRNDKRRVQPFGEYLPWRGFFRLFSEYADRAGFFEPGVGPGVVTLNQVPVGVAICWEIAFDDLVNDSVRNGAQLLAVPTNNATFGRSEMTFQQLAMSRLRAVEHDRSVLVAATSGVSAIIAPDGGVQARSALFAPAALVERVPLRTTTTLATRLGAIPEWLLVAFGVAALAAAVAGRGRRAASRPGRQPETSGEDEDD